MAVSFDRIKVGDTLYYVFRQKMGNTTMSTDAYYSYAVLEKDEENRRVKVRSNGREEWKGERFLKTARRSRPEFTTNSLGAKRLKKKERKDDGQANH